DCFFLCFTLRRAFLKMCNGPEAFLSLRSHFTSSHALLCVSHWVLGIGDRHLSNFMINMETGGMIGIDFGHSFGSATQVCLMTSSTLNMVRQYDSRADDVYLHRGTFCFLPVPPCAGAHALPTDSAACKSDEAVEGVRFDPEHDGPLPASLQG
ncbi:hypothetical protein GOODEAATRI_031608, partial [Goodea atripinnis]